MSTSVETYIHSLQVSRRHTARTLINYKRDLDRLAAFAKDQSLTLLQIDMHQMRRCVVAMSKANLHGKSIAHALSVWRGFYSWLHRQGAVSVNPAIGLRAPKSAKPLPKALSVDDAVSFAGFAGSGTSVSVRDQAIVELMYSCALRRAELVSMDTAYLKTAGYESQSWLDLGNNEVHVLGKGSKQRIVPIGSKAVAALAKWMQVREQFIKPSSTANARAALFLGEQGERINAGVVHARIKARAISAGIPASVHPHMLRHSAASHLLQSSGDLRAVQEFLGHTNISTTQIYTKLDWQHLASFYDAAHPRAKK